MPNRVIIVGEKNKKIIIKKQVNRLRQTPRGHCLHFGAPSCHPESAEMINLGRVAGGGGGGCGDDGSGYDLGDDVSIRIRIGISRMRMVDEDG